MIIEENISLRHFNTFGIEVKARFFAEVTGLVQLQKILQLKSYPRKFILGGGSNVLFTDDLDFLVVHLGLKGISVIEEHDSSVLIKVMAGENWHQLVEWCIEKDYGGLENLALIPGNAGTAPVQNIGAYGVEIKDRFVRCEAMDLESGNMQEFSVKDCKFGYRDSIFKNEYRNRFAITSVVFKLSKGIHQTHTEYRALKEELTLREIENPGLRDIADCVIHIRRSKLPDPEQLGNAGSFFKNPVISKRKFDSLQKIFPEIVGYPAEEGKQKLAAAWLIDQCGWKGFREGQAGVHHKQALVLVNHGGASGVEILNLSKKIQESVRDKFDVKLEPEVRIIGNQPG